MTVVTGPATSQPPVGHLLRDWRQRRRLSQLDLAQRAEVSPRHLSFVETGRSQPTSDMILRLARQLDVPLRDRNLLLLAGGYAPAFPTSNLTDPPLSAVSDAIERILHAHEPFPAAVIDSRWELIASNDAVDLLTSGVAPALLDPPVNVLRLSLHPDGIAPRIVNLPEWRAHLLDRLDRDISSAADRALIELRDELLTYPSPPADPGPDTRAILVPIKLRVEDMTVSLFSTTTVFGTPRDITLAELAIESFYPADQESARYLAYRSAAGQLRERV